MNAIITHFGKSCCQLNLPPLLPKMKVLKQLFMFLTFLVFSVSYSQTPTFCQDISGSSCSTCPTFTVANNPDLGVSCQETIDVILILDESNSIGNANAQNQVRDGVLAFLQELECSPVNVAIIEFGSVANYVVSNYSPAASVRTGMTNYFAGTPFNGQTYNPNQGDLGGTNWQAALLRANALPTADLLLMFTDGQPTAFTPNAALPGSSYDFCGSGNSTQAAEEYNAAVLANVIKGKGTHMFVLGVGNAVAGSIPSISGNDVYNTSVNSIANSDYEIDANINNVAACFRNLAKSLCPIIVDIQGSSICEGASNGTIDVELTTLATGPFTITVTRGSTQVSTFQTSNRNFTISNLIAGNYNVRVQAAGTCYNDGNANATVTTVVTQPIITNVTICSDESYLWPANNITYNGASGNTSVTIEGQGCDADQTLNLTVTPEPAPITTNVTICSDENYVWAENGLTYEGSGGSKTVNLEGENCAADRVLNLTVTLEPAQIKTIVTICSDETYVWTENGLTYEGSAGSTIVNIEGENCAADRILELTVTPEPAPIVTTVSICSDEEYTWSVNGVTYTTAQNITIEGDDCAADQTLVLTVNPATTIVAGNTVCGEDKELGFYSVDVTTNGGIVSSDFGTPVNNGGNSWTIINVPVNTNIVVTVTNNAGCDASVTVQAPECKDEECIIKLDYKYTDVTCFGANDGTIYIDYVTPGAIVTINGVPYDANTQYGPGSYEIYAFFEEKDKKDCYVKEYIEITEPKKMYCEILMDFNMDNLRCRANNQTYLTAAVTDGVGNLTYSWEIITNRNGWEILNDPSEPTIHFKPGVARATFKVTITDENGCQTYCSVEVLSGCRRGSGIAFAPNFAAGSRLDNNDPFIVQLYPNPVKDKLSIKLEEELISDVNVEIFDLVGTVVYKNVFSQSQAENMTIDCSQFRAQVYYVKITTDEGVVIKQVVLDK